MKTCIMMCRSVRLISSRISKKGIVVLSIIFIVIFPFSKLKSQTCDHCCLTAFPELTVYETTQTGHGFGFGIEAGNWKKDVGSFSYFFGTSMVWANGKTQNFQSAATQTMTYQTFYFKGQYKLTKHLYVVAAPGIVNLSYAELQTGLRYVVPLTRTVGVSIEPAYAFNQKQFMINANMHFALR